MRLNELPPIYPMAHTTYTVGRGVVSPKRLAAFADERGAIVGVCDTGQLGGAIEAHKACKGPGLIIPGIRLEWGEGDEVDAIVAWGPSPEAWPTLCRLASCPGEPPAGIADEPGIIVGAGVEGSRLWHTFLDGDGDAARALGREVKARWGAMTFSLLPRLGGAASAPLLPTASRMWTLDDADAPGLMLMAADACPKHLGGKRTLHLEHVEHWLPGWIGPEAGELHSNGMSGLARALVAEAYKAKLQVDAGELVWPWKTAAQYLPSPNGSAEADNAVIVQMCRGQLARADLLFAPRGAYEERLAFELDVITRMGFAGLILIVADGLDWVRAQGWLVGPGRGSAAGSLVCYLLGITSLDPIEHDLLFERFLNPMRVSLPDIDSDIEPAAKVALIDYLKERWGEANVAKILTTNGLGPRGAFKLVARTTGCPISAAEGFCETNYPEAEDPRTTQDLLDAGVFDVTREHKPRMYRRVQLAASIEGALSHTSEHAGGYIISSVPVVSVGPVSESVLQLDYKSAEALGLVKVDYLGLKELGVIARAMQLGAPAPPMPNRGQDDRAVWRMLGRGQTVGVFQLSGAGISRLCQLIRPETFEHIVAIEALYRPGPMGAGMLDVAVKRRHGREAPTYLHPDMAEPLASSWGIIIYQEQVMALTMLLAGYSLAEADLMRRAIGKKRPEEMEAQRARFVTGCVEHAGMTEPDARALFETIETFAGYGFNRSHAAAYAVLSYQTAWLKAYHPAELLAAQMSMRRDSDEDPIYAAEATRLGIIVEPPRLGASELDATVNGMSIRYGLGQVRGVAGDELAALMAAPAGLSFVELVNQVKMSTRSWSALISAGAFDHLIPAGVQVWIGRASWLHQLGDLCASSDARRGKADQARLFSLEDEGFTARMMRADELAAEGLTAWEMGKREFAALHHFLTLCPPAMAREGGGRTETIDQINAGDLGRYATWALVIRAQRQYTRQKQVPYWRLTIADETGQAEVFDYDEGARTHQTGVTCHVTLKKERRRPDRPPRLSLGRLNVHRLDRG